jgi:hypothetical protein
MKCADKTTVNNIAIISKTNIKIDINEKPKSENLHRRQTDVELPLIVHITKFQFAASLSLIVALLLIGYQCLHLAWFSNPDRPLRYVTVPENFFCLIKLRIIFAICVR